MTRAQQLQAFIARNNGHEVVTPCTGHAPSNAQCKDLVDAWARYIGKHCFTGNAVALRPTKAGEWKWVPNSPAGVPPLGAVVVVSHWSRGADGRYYNFGHTMIALPRCTDHTIYSFDQNWSWPHHARPETHVGYNVTNWRVLGWWVPLQVARKSYTKASKSKALSASDVARIFGVSPRTVTRWANAGKIRVFRTPGGHRRYPREDVERLVAS